MPNTNYEQKKVSWLFRLTYKSKTKNKKQKTKRLKKCLPRHGKGQLQNPICWQGSFWAHFVLGFLIVDEA